MSENGAVINFTPTAKTEGTGVVLFLCSFVLYFPTRKSTGTPTRYLGFGREVAFCFGSALLGNFARGCALRRATCVSLVRVLRTHTYRGGRFFFATKATCVWGRSYRPGGARRLMQLASVSEPGGGGGLETQVEQRRPLTLCFGEFMLRLVTVSKKAISKLNKESRPRAGRWRCCTVARRRDVAYFDYFDLEN